MVNKEITNLPVSLKQKIINSTGAKNVHIIKWLYRYFMERFLYRMTKSKYANNFILRGSSLLYIYTKEKARYTRDIDYMGISISNDTEYMKNIFKEICNIECLEDGIIFNADEIRVETINATKKYMGVRLFIPITFGNIQENLKFDIGFDDVITPGKKLYKYPLILSDDIVPGFDLYGYTIETSLAEKIESIISNPADTTRMKDFYDIWFIFNNVKLNFNILNDAIENTFRHRNTERDRDSMIFDIEYYKDRKRCNMWNNFIKNSYLDYRPFEEIGKFIIDNVQRLI